MLVIRTLAFIALVVWHCNCTTADVKLDIPPRLQWEGLGGYCGETSFQSHGILWGNWLHSDTVRKAAGSELLIGENDVKAAKTLKFPYESFQQDESATAAQNNAAYLTWLRNQVDLGRTVVVGWFVNPQEASKLDLQYDHIMPLTGYQYDTATKKTLGFHFNDLYAKTGMFMPITGASSKVLNRAKCQSSNPKTTMYCVPASDNFAIALNGIVDQKKETFRTTLLIPIMREPDVKAWSDGDGSHAPEKPVSFKVSAKIWGLKQGNSYAVLKFAGSNNVPTSNFLAGKWSKSFNFTAKGTSQTLTNFDTLMTSDSVFYRTVKVSSPTAKPTAKPTTKPTAKPTTKPTTKPPTAKPTAKATAMLTAKPAGSGSSSSSSAAE